MLTIWQNLGSDKKVTITFVGDANNVSYSLSEIALTLGHHMRFSGPENYNWNEEQLAHFKQLSEQYGGSFTLFEKPRSEEHTSELQSRGHLVCRLLLETKK